MRKILLAGVGIIISTGTAYAACIPTPSCSSLGYESSSSCEGGIKCPFGNAWNCTLVNKITEITTEITEIKKVIEEGGVGGKGDTSNCVVGSIFYSDWTCSYGSVIATKAPIGVVIYSDNAGHGQVMALNSIGTYKWGGYGTDIPTLQNFTSASVASQDLASCKNTAKIIAAGDKNKYPAAWAAHEYKTVGTNAGDWCLPAAGIMTSIKNNMEQINIGYDLVSGTKIERNYYIWSSSEYDSDFVWLLYLNFGYGLNYDNLNKSYSSVVRPVLEF